MSKVRVNLNRNSNLSSSSLTLNPNSNPSLIPLTLTLNLNLNPNTNPKPQPYTISLTLILIAAILDAIVVGAVVILDVDTHGVCVPADAGLVVGFYSRIPPLLSYPFSIYDGIIFLCRWQWWRFPSVMVVTISL